MIRFRLYRVPVGFHLSALIIALIGWQVYTGWELAGWTIGVLVAVLLHEAGHAYTALAFRAGSVSITLFALGGYTTWAEQVAPIGSGKRLAISAAGSAAGIAVGLVVFGMGRALGLGSLGFRFFGLLVERPETVVAAFSVALLDGFVLAALIWGLLNWIPVLPLDGGHMTLSLLDLVWPERSERIAKGISLVAGSILVAVAVYFEYYFAAVFLVIIVLMGVRSRPARPTPDPPPAPPGAMPPVPRESGEAPGGTERTDRSAEPPEFPI